MKKTLLNIRKLCINHSFLSLAALMVSAMPGYADSATWNGSTNVWATVTNWSGPPAAVPGAADTATFSSTGQLTVAGGGATVNSLAFDSTAQAYSISGLNIASGSLSIANGAALQTATLTVPSTSATTLTVENNSALANGINLNLTANAPTAAVTTVTFTGSGTTTLTAALASIANTSTNLTSIVKNGTGTLDLGNFSNTNIFGGLTINQGLVIARNSNSTSNRSLTLNGGTLQHVLSNAQSFNNAAGLIRVTADSTLHYAAASGNWRMGGNAGAQLISTGTPTLTFTNTTPNINGIQLMAQTHNFNGTWKLGQNGAVSLNQTYATGSTGVHLDMGDTGTGSHYFAAGASFHTTGATQGIIPLRFGALSGTDAGAILVGRQSVGNGTTGVRYEVGFLNSSTTYSGAIRDGHTSNGNLTLNGLPDATNQTSPFTSNYLRTSGAAGSQGTLEFVKHGTGTLTLAGVNTHTGGTVISNGVLAVAADNALGAAYDGSLRPFQYSPGTGTYAVGTSSANGLPALILSGGNPTSPASIGVFSSVFNNNANNNLFTSFSSQDNNNDSGSIVNNLTGAGYSSVPSVTVSGGAFATAGTAPMITLRVKGLLTLDGGTLRTDASFSSNRAVYVGAAGGTIETNGNTLTLSGVVNGPGVLTKQGMGTLELTGTSTVTPTKLVATAGTVTITGTYGGEVELQGSAALAGTGTINANLTFTGDADLDVTGASIALSSTGILTVSTGSTISLTDFTYTDIVGWDATTAALGTYTLINGGTATFAGSTPTFASPATLPNGNTFYFQSGSLQAVIGAGVPEASSAVLLLLGSAATLLRRRRR